MSYDNIVPALKMNNQFYPSVEEDKIWLEGIGEVYVHRVGYEKYQGYPITENYSRKPDSMTIQGIEWFGHFRLYSDLPVHNDSTYYGDIKIEFLADDNSIIKTTNPLTLFDLFSSGVYKQNTSQLNTLNHI